MKFITILPKVKGRDYIYVVVDRLTKYSHLFSIRMEYSSSKVVYILFMEVFRLHSLPRNIVSDCDSRFLSVFWWELFKLSRTNLTPSTSYHPQTNGKNKIINDWVEGYLKNYVLGKQWAWIKWLHLSEHCYNNTRHMSIKLIPFK